MWFYNQLKLGLTDRRLRVIVFNIITQKGKWKHTTGSEYAAQFQLSRYVKTKIQA
jgi:hypothetical protein